MKSRQSNFKYYFSAVIFGIIIVFSLIYLLRVNKIAEAIWWNDSWAYKKTITIDHDKVGIISDIASDANSGQKNITVKDGTLFTAGETVVIKDSLGRETNTVASVAGNVVTMQNNLSYNYTTANSGFVKNTTDSIDLTNFPVLIDLSSDSSLASYAKSDGYDIVFTASDESTQLKHEIENYTTATGALTAWVKIPTLSTSEDTVIYMYYGNADSVDQSDRTNVWDSNFVTVQHLKDLTTSTVDDSTSNNKDGTKSSANNPIQLDSKIYKAQDFSSDIINYGSLSISNTYTVEAWIKTDTLGGAGDINTYGASIFASSNLGSGYPLWLTVGKGGGSEVNLRAFETPVDGHNSSGAGINTTDWFHIVAIATRSGSAKVYVNGVQRLSFTAGTVVWSGNFILGDLRAGRAIYFDGKIDEVRLSNNIRGFDWIATEYKNQNSPSTFYTIGGEEEKPSPVEEDDLTASSTTFIGGTTTSTFYDPILYYNFNEGYGTTVYNHSSTTINGTINGATWTNDGKFGKALGFNGSSNYVDTGFSDNLSASDFSVSAWIKIPNGASTNYAIAQTHTSSPYTSDWFFPYASGSSIFWFRSVQLGTYSTINDGSWHHLMLVWDQSDAKYTGYVDGKSIGISSTVSNYGGIGSVKIGARADLTSTFFNGLIDEVKIYNYALSSNQVKLDYNQGMAMVMGSTGTSTSASSAYCVPGDASYCVAPIAEYKFEKKSGDTAYDTSGNGNDGTISGAVSARGRIGSAMSFDGTDDYINFGSASTLDNITIKTIEFWTKLDSLYPNGQPGDHFINKGDTGWFIATDSTSGGRNIFGHNFSGTAGRWSFPKFNTGAWYHVVLIYDKGSISNDPIVYVNGVSQTVTEYSTPSGTANSDASFDLLISKSPGYSRYVDGIIDEVRIYNYARTRAQIAWDYNKGAPIAHYKFDECSGTTIYDESGNGNNGTISIGASGSQNAVGTCTDEDTTHAWYNGATGKYNSSMSFDGTDDYVNCGNDLNLRMQDNFTVSAWVKFSGTLASNRYFIDRWDATNSKRVWGYLVRANKNYISLIISSNGTSVEYAEGTKAVNDNNFHHVSFVRSGQTVRLYVDGSLDIERTTATGLLFNTDTELKIGKSLYNGLIDDVKIFNYALTSTQVKSLYNGGAVRFK